MRNRPGASDKADCPFRSETPAVDVISLERAAMRNRWREILDPIADKILVLSAFISFVTMGLIYAWMVALIILRDLLVTAIRFLLEYRGMPMSTSKRAKGKTAVQITIIILILSYLSLKSYQVTWVTEFVENGQLIMIFMFLTVLFTVYTGIDYFVVNRASIRTLAKPNTS